VVLPLVFLVIQAAQVGWHSLHQLVFRSLTGELIRNTLTLTVVITVLCALVGTLTAWFVERTAIPGRRFWAVLVVVPLGIPDFVVSFGWRAIFPSFGGFWASVLVMTLAVYPLVFLPVAASLRNADPAQEEVARSLGLGRMRTFWRVTVGQARLAILGGSVLVGLVVLAEFGAFEILGFRTLTTEIYTEFTVGFDTPAACAFSLRERGTRGGPWVSARFGRSPPTPAPAPGPYAPSRPRWRRIAGGPRPRRAGGGHHLLAGPGRELDTSFRLTRRRRRVHVLVLRRGGRGGHHCCAAVGPALHPLPRPAGAFTRTGQHARAGHTRPGHRLELHLLH
jgi:ABC-type sulfate transport system permease component